MKASKETQSVRKGFVLGAALVVLLAATLAFMHKTKAVTPAIPAVASKPTMPSSQNVSISKPVVASATAHTAVPTSAAGGNQPAPYLTVNQLVDELAQIGNGPVTPEQAARFKADLKELIKRGALSVPAIQDFLKQNINTSYGDVQGGDQLGYSSLRTSLIDALNQIGGPQAQAAMLDAMNTTAVPAELLQLAQDLDKQSPGEYSGQIAQQAQQTLAMASSGQLGTNTELGPAFRAFQNYGGANNTTANAAINDPLDFYNAVQLANMPNGQGLSSLLQMEQNSSGDTQAVATQMIAQMAGQNGDALSALTQMAQNGQISPNEWVQLAPILGGNQYQMNSSGNDYTMNNNLTQDQIQQRIQMLNAFMGSVTPGTGAYKAMQQQITTLTGRLGN